MDEERLRGLLAAAADGDEATFARIVEGFHDQLLRVAFVVTGDVDRAPDAANAAWAKAWRGLATMRNPDRFRAWLLALAATEARKIQQAGARAAEKAGADAAGVVPTAAASAPAYKAEERVLADALAEMDPQDRMLVGLRWVAGLTSDEIGTELGMRAPAVRARLGRILGRAPGQQQEEPETAEPSDDEERALAERLRSLTDRAVIAFEAEAVAKTAVEAEPEPTTAEQLALVLEQLRTVPRFIWFVAGGFLLVVLVAAMLGGGSAPGGLATVTPFPTDATRLCLDSELELRITGWAGAPGNRGATVEMRNIGGVACLVDTLPEPWLIDKLRTPLLVGQDLQGSVIRIGPGDVFRTVVSARNYCGNTPQAPVTVAFRQGTTVFVAAPLSNDDVSGVPTCSGGSGSGGDLTMRAWSY
jgi:RNA polymerase sigma factor (sigma-70 family)